MLVKLGNLFFHFRNYFFAVMYAALFISSYSLFTRPAHAHLIGGIIIGLGILVRGATIGLDYIIRGGVNRQIHAETLVTGGIYKVCRNPMYLGNLILLLGFGLFSNSLLFIALFFPLFVFIYFAIIKAEETFLFNKFGHQFLEYKHQTNALFPKLGKLDEAFKGHRFNFKKVIAKEYNSLYLYFEGVLLLLLYHRSLSPAAFLTGTGILTALYGIVRLTKKKKMSV